MTTFTHLLRSRQALVFATLSSIAVVCGTSESLRSEEKASSTNKSAGATIDFAPAASLMKSDRAAASSPSPAVLDKHYRQLAEKLAARHSFAELEKTTTVLPLTASKMPVAAQPIAQTNHPTTTYYQSGSNSNTVQNSSQSQRGGIFGGRRTQSTRTGVLRRRR